jgi:homoserine dehydrogenase
LYRGEKKVTKNREVPVIFLGLGNVGGALLRQILDTRKELARRDGLHLVPIALADLSGLLFDAGGLPEESLHAALAVTTGGGYLDALPGIHPLNAVEDTLRSGAVLADLTASSNTRPTLEAALDEGCRIVLANKIPLVGPWAKARALMEHSRLRYEVTVGAGLPVIATLRYLLDTGDRIMAIEGCFSGTLGYLCAQLERGESYATVVHQARALGYTEPDPREDLSGRDVARKALILARTVRLSTPTPTGWPLDMSDLTVEALYPDSLTGVTTDAFMDAASTLNESYDAAQARRDTLRYVARISTEDSEVRLTAVPQDSALGALHGPANYVAFHTERYADVPLVISGPGAGPEVTAAGVLGDIIDVVRRT